MTPQPGTFSKPHSKRAFVAILHGDSPDFLLYALVLARQLRLFSRGPDRVLLLGPGCWQEPPCCRALRAAGWTHVQLVEAIAARHLDKSYRGRHELVFTKLRALEVPYKQVVFLDLDLLPRSGRDLCELFDVAAPAGKYHGAHRAPPHGALVPAEARAVAWCPNMGVVRLDPRPTAEGRRQQVDELVGQLFVVGWEAASYLPDQYFLAEKLTNWRHISRWFNYEVALGIDEVYVPPEGKEKALERTKVWHYSGKCGLQPTMFLDLKGDRAVRRLLQEHYSHQDPTGLIAAAFAEWRHAADGFLKEAMLWGDPLPAEVVQQAVEKLRDKGPADRGTLPDQPQSKRRMKWEAPQAPRAAGGRARHRCEDAWRPHCDLEKLEAAAAAVSSGHKGGRDALKPARQALGEMALPEEIAHDPRLQGKRKWGGDSRPYEFEAFVAYFQSHAWVWSDGPLDPVCVARIAWFEAQDASQPDQFEPWPEDYRQKLSALVKLSDDPMLQGRRFWGSKSYSFVDFVHYYGDCWNGTLEGAIELAKIAWLAS